MLYTRFSPLDKKSWAVLSVLNQFATVTMGPDGKATVAPARSLTTDEAASVVDFMDELERTNTR